MQGRSTHLLQRRSLQKSSDPSSRAKEVGNLVDQMLDSFLQTTNAYHLLSFSLAVVLSIGRSLLDQIFFVVSPLILTSSYFAQSVTPFWPQIVTCICLPMVSVSPSHHKITLLSRECHDLLSEGRPEHQEDLSLQH